MNSSKDYAGLTFTSLSHTRYASTDVSSLLGIGNLGVDHSQLIIQHVLEQGFHMQCDATLDIYCFTAAFVVTWSGDRDLH